jgi:hypothetical protein
MNELYSKKKSSVIESIYNKFADPDFNVQGVNLKSMNVDLIDFLITRKTSTVQYFFGLIYHYFNLLITIVPLRIVPHCLTLWKLTTISSVLSHFVLLCGNSRPFPPYCPTLSYFMETHDHFLRIVPHCLTSWKLTTISSVLSHIVLLRGNSRSSCLFVIVFNYLLK